LPKHMEILSDMLMPPLSDGCCQRDGERAHGQDDPERGPVPADGRHASTAAMSNSIPMPSLAPTLESLERYCAASGPFLRWGA
jgi:hypothetical protein